jgi:hypothetical protein
VGEVSALRPTPEQLAALEAIVEMRRRGDDPEGLVLRAVWIYVRDQVLEAAATTCTRSPPRRSWDRPCACADLIRALKGKA